MVQLLWKTVGRLLRKLKTQLPPCSSNPTSVYISKRTEGKVSRYLQTYVHSSTTHNSQQAEAIQVSYQLIRDKQNIVHTYNGMLFRLKREVIWSLLQHGRILRMKVKIRQSQKTDTVWFHLKQVSGVTKFIETQTRNMVARN